MSMLSARCDELRELALWLDDEFYDVEAAKVRDAADTILELRDDLQRANDAVRDAEHDESCAWDRVRKAEAENARLRELVNSYADSFEKDAAMNNGCGPYYSGEDWLALANDMRIELAECCGELGIEMQ